MASPPMVPEADYQRLREQYQELAQLAGALAHEIKNPLSTIRLNMDLLAEDFAADNSNGKARRAVRTIETVRNQCARLENLLNDFLRFSRLQNLNLRPGSLNDQIECVLDLYEAHGRESEVEIIRYLDPDLPSILLDGETLQAALVNLVKNSLEAMPEGGVLTARTRTTRYGVALDLIDTGCGMDEATARRMFEAFFSTKHGGSGLGLPTARRVIEAHRGRIDVQSTVNRGTKFTLEFPTPRGWKPRRQGNRIRNRASQPDEWPATRNSHERRAILKPLSGHLRSWSFCRSRQRVHRARIHQRRRHHSRPLPRRGALADERVAVP